MENKSKHGFLVSVRNDINKPSLQAKYEWGCKSRQMTGQSVLCQDFALKTKEIATAQAPRDDTFFY